MVPDVARLKNRATSVSPPKHGGRGQGATTALGLGRGFELAEPSSERWILAEFSDLCYWYHGQTAKLSGMAVLTLRSDAERRVPGPTAAAELEEYANLSYPMLDGLITRVYFIFLTLQVSSPVVTRHKTLRKQNAIATELCSLSVCC
jgi:hypothetical protein